MIVIQIFSGVVSGEPGFDNRIDFLIQPIISEDFVNTSLTLTCSGYYMLEGDNLKVDLDVLWSVLLNLSYYIENISIY